MAVGTRAGVAYVDVKLSGLSGLTRQMSQGVDAAAKAAAAKAGKEISKGIQAGAAGIGGIKGPSINTSSVDKLKRSLNEAAVAGRQLGKDLGVVGQQIVGVGRKAAGLGQAFIRPLKPVGAAINNYLLKPLASIASSVGSRIGNAARGVGNALAAPFRAAGNAARAFAAEVKGRFTSAIADVGARMRLAGASAAQFGGRVRNMWTVAKQTSPVLGALSGAAGRFGGALRGAVAPMANVVRSSGALGASLGRVGGALGGVARAASGPVMGGLRRVGGAISGLASRAVGFAGSFRSTMGTVGQHLSTFSRKLGLTGFMIQNLGHTMTIAFTAPVAAIAALTFKLGGGLVNTMQNAKISFEAFTGSAKIATNTVQRLRKYATDSPIFDTQSAITYAKQLMGVGVTMKQLFPSLNTIQYLTAKYGLTAEETDGIVLAWTQTLSKGKAYSEELTQQMSEHGIPIWQILAKAFGVSQAKMHEMVKDGQVDAKSFENAMIKVGQAGDFDKVIKAKANTFEGVWDRMKESVSNSLADAILKNQKPIREFLDSFSNAVKLLAANAGPFISGLAKAFVFLGNALGVAARWFNGLSDPMKQTISNVVLLLAAAGPLVIILGSLLGGVAGIAAGLSALATALAAVTLPMVAAVVIIGAYVAGLTAMYLASKSFRDVINGLAGLVFGLWKALGSAVIKTAADGFSKFANAAHSLWVVLDQQLFPAIASIIKDVRDKLTPIWQKIGGVVGKVVSFAFARLADFVQKVLIPVIHFLTKQFQEHHDMIVNVIKVVGILVGIIVGVLVGALLLAAAVFVGTLVASILIVTSIVAGLIWFFGTGIPAAFNWCKKAIASVGNFFTTVFGAVWGFLKGVGAWFAGPFVQFFVSAGKAIAKPFLWLWHNVLDPMWQSIKLAARFVAFVVTAAFLIMQAAAVALGKIFLWLYNKNVKPALDAIARAANWLWVNVLYPAFNAIKAGIKSVGDFFLWVYNHGIKPMFDAVARAANWLWVHVLYPAFNAIKTGMKAVGDFFLWVYNHLIKPMFDAVARGINWLWVHVLFPAFNAIKAGARAWGNLFLWVYNHLIKPMYDAVARGINYLWVHVLFPAFNAIKAGFRAVGTFFVWVYNHLIKVAWDAVKAAINYLWVHILYPAFNAIKHGWSLVGNLVKSVWKNVIKPAWKAVQDAAFHLKDKIADAFNQAKAAVTRIWNAIKNAVKTPIIAVIKFVKDGVLGSIKAAANKFGFKDIASKMGSAQGTLDKILAGIGGSTAGIKKLATGGHVRGAGGPTADKIPAWLSNGEYVIRAAAVKKLGVPYLNRLNQADKMRVPGTDAMYASGGPAWKNGLPGFRNGNYVPNLITKIAQKFQSGVRMSSGFRGGSVSLSGNSDYHSQGLAADLVSGNMDALAAKWYTPKVRSYLLEEIHTRMGSNTGWYVKNGKAVSNSFYGAEVPVHRDHVHIAMSQGSAESLFKQLSGPGGASLLDKIKSFAGSLAGGPISTFDWITDAYNKYFKGPAKTLAGLGKGNGVLGDFTHSTAKMLWDKALSWIKDKIMSSAAATGGDGSPYAKGIPTSGTLAGWIKKAMKLTHVDGKPGWYEKLYSIAMRESRGDPRAINNYDINAKNGIPSKGVMQIIPPMYKKFHQAGTSWNMYDPISNIAAAINYIKGVYGSPQNTPANYYDNGGWLQPGKAAINATNKPELALNESQGRALERRISGYDQPMHVTVNTPAVAMDEGQFTAVMTRVVNQNRGIRPN